MSQSENRITIKKILEFSLLFNDCVYVMYSVLPYFFECQRKYGLFLTIRLFEHPLPNIQQHKLEER